VHFALSPSVHFSSISTIGPKCRRKIFGEAVRHAGHVAAPRMHHWRRHLRQVGNAEFSAYWRQRTASPKATDSRAYKVLANMLFSLGYLRANFRQAPAQFSESAGAPWHCSGSSWALLRRCRRCSATIGRFLGTSWALLRKCESRFARIGHFLGSSWALLGHFSGRAGTASHLLDTSWALRCQFKLRVWCAPPTPDGDAADFAGSQRPH
jgi:hypothetical protein